MTIDRNSLFDSEPESVESSSGESSDDEVSVNDDRRYSPGC